MTHRTTPLWRSRAAVEPYEGHHPPVGACMQQTPSQRQRLLPLLFLRSSFFFLPRLSGFGFEQPVDGGAGGHDFPAVDPVLNRRQCPTLPVVAKRKVYSLTKEQRGCVWNAAVHFRGHGHNNQALAGFYPRRYPPRRHLVAEKTPRQELLFSFSRHAIH